MTDHAERVKARAQQRRRQALIRMFNGRAVLCEPGLPAGHRVQPELVVDRHLEAQRMLQEVK